MRREWAERRLPAWLFAFVEQAHRFIDRAGRRLTAGTTRRRHVGSGSFIERDVHGLGWRSIRIGANVVVCSRTVFNVNFPDRARCRIEIGDWSFVGQHNFFSPGEKIEAGPYLMTGPRCQFLGADHVFDDPMLPYVASGVVSKGIIRIGCNVWFGAASTVMGAVTIGHGSIIGANAMVMNDLPPFSIAVGNPARVVRRYDFLSGQWVRADAFTAEMAAALPDEDAYRSEIAARTPHISMPYAAAGPQRGDLS